MQVHLAALADPYLLPASASCPAEAAAMLMTLSGDSGLGPTSKFFLP